MLNSKAATYEDRIRELAEAHAARDLKNKPTGELVKRGNDLVAAAQELTLRLRDGSLDVPTVRAYSVDLKSIMDELNGIESALEASQRKAKAAEEGGPSTWEKLQKLHADPNADKAKLQELTSNLIRESGGPP